jgi:hypothetical protein
VQGTYRIFGPKQELVESFVAAPGPMGWRYFAHVHRQDDLGQDLYTVDLVTDLEWHLVRFRLATVEGWVAVATAAAGAVEVVHGSPNQEAVDVFDEGSVVWSSSPSSLLVLHRLLGPQGGTVKGLVIEPHATPVAVDLSLAIIERTSVPTASGANVAERIRVTAGGRELEALVRPDLPLSVGRWFELIA